MATQPVTGLYTWTPAIWSLVAAAVYLAVLGLYSWRRRSVTAARWLIAGSLIGVLLLLGLALEVAAIDFATKAAWHKFAGALLLFAATTSACFALDYAYPGRWLGRRNLLLLWLPPLLFALLVVTGPQLVWHSMEVAPDGTVAFEPAAGWLLGAVYGVGLLLVMVAAFLWLLVKSPPHRWPATLMLLGQLASRGMFLVDAVDLPWTAALDPTVAAIVLVWTTHAIALFGFRIFDPLPAARLTALEQMRDAMVVLDLSWRVAGLNRSAAGLAGVPASRARGMAMREVFPALPDLSARPSPGADLQESAGTPALPEISLGTGSDARRHELELSPLHDFRGLPVGRLLLLRDVTEQRRAQGRLLDEQRVVATLRERERLARELHDGLGQALVAAHLQASTVKLLLAQGNAAEAAECLNDLLDTTLQAQTDVREYLLAARTAFSAGTSFFAALRDYAVKFSRQHGIPVELSAPPALEERGLPQAIEVQLLRIVQEALSNVRKHADASRAQVCFAVVDGQLHVAITDDGRGFDPAATLREESGYGLRAMRERAEALGGSVTVRSAQGAGAEVLVLLPLHE